MRSVFVCQLCHEACHPNIYLYVIMFPLSQSRLLVSTEFSSLFLLMKCHKNIDIDCFTPIFANLCTLVISSWRTDSIVLLSVMVIFTMASETTFALPFMFLNLMIYGPWLTRARTAQSKWPVSMFHCTPCVDQHTVQSKWRVSMFHCTQCVDQHTAHATWPHFTTPAVNATWPHFTTPTIFFNLL